MKTSMVILRLKAFIVDMFIIMTPLLYIFTYLILNGADDFKNSATIRVAVVALYGLIIIIFWIKSGQTPGYKAYNIKLVSLKTNQNITFLQGVARYLLFLVAGATILLLFLPIFRKDSQAIYDIFSYTKIIKLN